MHERQPVRILPLEYVLGAWALGLCFGCGESAAVTDAGADAAMDVAPFDSGSADEGVAPDATTPCSLPSELEVRAGGRLRVPRSGPWLEGELRVEGPARDDALALVDEEGVTLYAPYDVDEARWQWSSERCGSVELRVGVAPLEWTLLDEWDAEDTTRPAAREYPAFWFQDNAVHIFSGFVYEPRQFTPTNEYWRYDLAAQAWSAVDLDLAPIAPGARAVFNGEDVRIHGGAVLGDGLGLDTSNSDQFFRLGSGPNWEAVEPNGGAPLAYTGIFVWDARRERYLSLCDLDGCNVNAYTDEGGWVSVETQGQAPTWRIGSHFAFDEEGDRIVIAGGQGRRDPVGDTWALELGHEIPRWVKLFDEDPEVLRRNGAYVWDPIGRRLLLWGGTPNGARSSAGLAILRLEEGHERWDFVDVDRAIPARTSGFAVYDAEGERALLGFGNNAVELRRDLYSLAL